MPHVPESSTNLSAERRECGVPGTTLPVCPACGGELIDIRHKLQCSRCHTICETCCEGGRG